MKRLSREERVGMVTIAIVAMALGVGGYVVRNERAEEAREEREVEIIEVFSKQTEKTEKRSETHSPDKSKEDTLSKERKKIEVKSRSKEVEIPEENRQHRSEIISSSDSK